MPKILPSRSAVLLNPDSCITIFASHEFLPVDVELNRTPPSESEIGNLVEDCLLKTRFLFLRRMNEFEQDEFDNDSVGDIQGAGQYSVENSLGERVLVIKQILGNYDQHHMRLPISYDVFNRSRELIFTLDGKDKTFCGEQVLLKGIHNVVRGKVSSNGPFSYKVKDFVTGNYYQVSIPVWMAISVCLLRCFQPTLHIKKLPPSSASHHHHLFEVDDDIDIDNPPDTPDYTVALIGKRRWEGTLYEDQVRFAIYFVNSEETPDSKLFIFSAALVLFHLYFKRTRCSTRCIITYVFLVLIFGAVLIVAMFVLNEL